MFSVCAPSVLFPLGPRIPPPKIQKSVRALGLGPWGGVNHSGLAWDRSFFSVPFSLSPRFESKQVADSTISISSILSTSNTDVNISVTMPNDAKWYQAISNAGQSPAAANSFVFFHLLAVASSLVRPV